MAMSPRSTCLESNWAYAFETPVVTATCRNCEHEVSFVSKKAKLKAGQPPKPDSPPFDLSDRYVPSVPDPSRDPALLPWE